MALTKQDAARLMKKVEKGGKAKTVQFSVLCEAEILESSGDSSALLVRQLRMGVSEDGKHEMVSFASIRTAERQDGDGFVAFFPGGNGEEGNGILALNIEQLPFAISANASEPEKVLPDGRKVKAREKIPALRTSGSEIAKAIYRAHLTQGEFAGDGVEDAEDVVPGDL